MKAEKAYVISFGDSDKYSVPFPSAFAYEWAQYEPISNVMRRAHKKDYLWFSQ